MTRAKDISKIVTDADLSGTLDVTGAVTVGGLTVDGSAVTSLTLNTNVNGSQIAFDDGTSGTQPWQVGVRNNGSNDFLIYQSGAENIDIFTNNALRQTISSGGDISFYEDTGTTPKLFWDASEEALGIGTTSPTLGSTGYGLHIKGGTNKDGTLKLDSTTANYSGVIQFTENGTDQWRIAYDGTNNHLEFTESGVADRMVIQDGGKVGIGDSSPDGLLTIKGNSDSSSQPSIRLKDGTDTREAFVTNQSGDLIMGTSNSSDDVVDSSINILTSNILFKIANAERMRIDSSGNVAIGVTTAAARFDVTSNINPLVKFHQQSTANDIGVIMQHARGLSGFSGKMIAFRRNDGTEVGSVVIGVSSTSYNTSSDYRLKENVAADWDATTRLKQLNPVRFNFIADADTTVDGFLAHEVQSVVPEAITGTHNEVDDDGNPVYQGIDQSKLVPLLVKTIQELEARIVALETA